MEAEQHNPEYTFLFDLSSPEHIYYRCVPPGRAWGPMRAAAHAGRCRAARAQPASGGCAASSLSCRQPNHFRSPKPCDAYRHGATPLSTPGHRWRVYSLAEGDSLRTWRIEPFVMVEGGQRWHAPSMTAMSLTAGASPGRPAIPGLFPATLMSMVTMYLSVCLWQARLLLRVGRWLLRSGAMAGMSGP